MDPNNSSNEKVSLQKRIEMDESNVPVEEQTVAANLDDPASLLRRVAEEHHDDNLERRLAPRTDSRGSTYKYDWSRSPDLEPGRRYSETLAGQERRLGQEAEQERHGELARSAHLAGDERGRASRAVVDAMEWHDDDVNTCDVWALPAEWVAETDLTETVSDDVASQVREQAARIQERVAGAPSAGLLRRWIVERVRRGQDLVAAVDDVHREAQRWTGAVQAISTIRWGDDTATVEGTIEKLWDPEGDGQQQVGMLHDDEGQSVKFTIWQNSMKRVRLREGDRVRVEGAKVNVYNQTVTLAATSNTEIRVLEKGSGPAKWKPKGTPNRPDDPTPVEARDEVVLVCPVDGCSYEASTRRMELHVAGMAKDGDEAHEHAAGDVATLLDEGQYVRTRSKEETMAKKFPDEREGDDWAPLGRDSVGEACPSCGSDDTYGYQQQTGSADEGMTGFHRCSDCDASWRSGYGA